MKHSYRATWTELVGRYEWPALDDPRFDALMARGWDEVTLILLEYVKEWMTAAKAYAVDLDSMLVKRAGPAWWREDAVGAVETWLDSL